MAQLYCHNGRLWQSLKTTRKAMRIAWWICGGTKGSKEIRGAACQGRPWVHVRKCHFGEGAVWRVIRFWNLFIPFPQRIKGGWGWLLLLILDRCWRPGVEMLTDSSLVTASGRGTSEKASWSGPTAGDDGGGASSTSTVPRILQCMGQVPWRNNWRNLKELFLPLVHFFSNQWCTIWVYISIQCAYHKFKYMSFLFFEYFSSVDWGRQVIDTSRYMADYESTAYMSLERLKEQHGEELGKFQEMIRPLASGSSIKKVFLLVSTFSDSRLPAILCVFRWCIRIHVWSRVCSWQNVRNTLGIHHFTHVWQGLLISCRDIVDTMRASWHRVTYTIQPDCIPLRSCPHILQDFVKRGFNHHPLLFSTGRYTNIKWRTPSFWGHQPARVKCSRELLELRRKQEALAKLGKYAAWTAELGNVHGFGSITQLGRVNFSKDQ